MAGKGKKKAGKPFRSSCQVTLSLPRCEAAHGKPRQLCCLVVFGVAGSAWAVPLTCINQLCHQVPLQWLKPPVPLFSLAAEMSPSDTTSANPTTFVGQKQPGTAGRLLLATAGG